MYQYNLPFTKPPKYNIIARFKNQRLTECIKGVILMKYIKRYTFLFKNVYLSKLVFPHLLFLYYLIYQN